jgi:two-component system, LuxR family, sensor kinase FixL
MILEVLERRDKMRSWKGVSDSGQLLFAAILASTIFATGVLTTSGPMITVLYVIVVLVSAQFLTTPSIITVGIGCMLLTFADSAIGHGAGHGSSTGHDLVALCAITAATLLMCQGRRAETVADDRVTLLEFGYDTTFTRQARGGHDWVARRDRCAVRFLDWSGRNEPSHTPYARPSASVHQPMTSVFPAIRVDWTMHWQGQLVGSLRGTIDHVCEDRAFRPSGIGGLPWSVQTSNDVVAGRPHAEHLSQPFPAGVAATRAAAGEGSSLSIIQDMKQPLGAMMTDGTAGLRWLHRASPDLSEVQCSLDRMIASARRLHQLLQRLETLHDAPVGSSPAPEGKLNVDLMPPRIQT